jgi:hypothetical protein
MSTYNPVSVPADPAPSARSLLHAHQLAALIATQSPHPTFVDGLSEVTYGEEVSDAQY